MIKQIWHFPYQYAKVSLYRTNTFLIILNNCLKVSNLWVHHIQVVKKNGNFLLFYAVSCPPLSLENGEVVYNTSLLYDETYLITGYSLNTMASFSCDEFYSREGAKFINKKRQKTKN